MRADLKRLKREMDSGKSSVASANSPAMTEGTAAVVSSPSTPATIPAGSTPASPLAAAPAESVKAAVVSSRAFSGAAARHKYWIVAVVVIVFLAAGIWYGRSRLASPGIESIAVLPFAAAGGGADTDLLEDGITESLMASLAHVPGLKVKSRNSVFRYKGKDVDVEKVGKELTVDALLTGRIVERGDSLQVSAELTSVRDNTEIWGAHYDGKISDVLSLQERIANDLAGKLRSNMSGSEKQQVARQGTQNPEAYQLYVKGRYAWNKRTAADLQAAISYFNQALEKDPSYAMAYVGLADVYSVIDDYASSDPKDVIPKAKAAAARAIELDPTLARPHANLGIAKMQFDWDFASGEAELRKAFELDPSDATAHQWLCQNLSYLGKGREGIEECNRARELDPLSPIITYAQAESHIFSHQYEDAIELFKRAIADNPTFPAFHQGLAFAHWGKREYADSIREYQTLAQLSGGKDDAEYAAALDLGFRSGGWAAAQRKTLEVMLKQWKARANYRVPYQIAEAYAELGDKDQAIKWLSVCYQEHSPYMVLTPGDFTLDPLRSDPRYIEFAKKVGFPQ